MKIRIWNAFASNNSGSYTIVGSFRSAEDAARVAEELRAVIDAHHAWLASRADRWTPSAQTPFASFMQREGIADPSLAIGDDWPEHGPKPEITAVFSQVVLHVDYTVSMPAALGQFFYRRGGRVDVELDHSHAPLVWTHEVWWPWQNRDAAKVTANVLAVLDELWQDDGPFATGSSRTAAPSWTNGHGGFGEPDLALAVVWETPIEHVAALAALVERHGAAMRTRVLESWSHEDPAGLHRPSRPALPGRLWDVALLDSGAAPAEVRRVLSEVLFDTNRLHADAVRIEQSHPGVIVRAWPRGRAEGLAERLTTAGARAEVREHDAE